MVYSEDEGVQYLLPYVKTDKDTSVEYCSQ